MLRQGTNFVFTFNTVLVLVVTDIKRTASFTDIEGIAKFTGEFVDDTSDITI